MRERSTYIWIIWPYPKRNATEAKRRLGSPHKRACTKPYEILQNFNFTKYRVRIAKENDFACTFDDVMNFFSQDFYITLFGDSCDLRFEYAQNATRKRFGLYEPFSGVRYALNYCKIWTKSVTSSMTISAFSAFQLNSMVPLLLCSALLQVLLQLEESVVCYYQCMHSCLVVH